MNTDNEGGRKSPQISGTHRISGNATWFHDYFAFIFPTTVQRHSGTESVDDAEQERSGRVQACKFFDNYFVFN